jgi:hypothetical protein
MEVLAHIDEAPPFVLSPHLLLSLTYILLTWPPSISSHLTSSTTSPISSRRCNRSPHHRCNHYQHQHNRSENQDLHTPFIQPLEESILWSVIFPWPLQSAWLSLDYTRILEVMNNEMSWHVLRPAAQRQDTFSPSIPGRC